MNIALTIGIGGIIGIVASANMLNFVAQVQLALNAIFGS